MKKWFTLAAVAFFLGSQAQKAQTTSVQKMNQFITSLMSRMTLEEKLGQLNLPAAGDITTGLASNKGIAQKIKEGKVGGLFNIKTIEKIREVQKIAVEGSRLKIPLLFGMDVIHGYKTIFPIPLGLSCTWDTALIEKTARVAATEASANGICWTFSPMVDIARDPRWGRIAEGAGEDAYLGAHVARAMVKGYQGNDLSQNNTIMACVKHFALYGAAEAGRDYNTTDMSRLRMYNEYFLPYKAAIEAGAGSVMSSFNEVDGIPASANRWLMTDVLRKQWKFNGFVVTDYTAINEMTDHGLGDLQTVSALALKAGINMDMVGEGFLTTLKKSLLEKKVTQKEVDDACRRVLEAKYKLGLFEDPYRYCNEQRAASETFTEANRKFSREVASQSFVLLKNEGPVLPLQKKGTVALIGPMADNTENMVGTWSVAADFKKSISLRQGLKNTLGEKADILFAKGANIAGDSLLESRVSTFGKPTYRDNRPETALVEEALAIARKSDVIIAAMGESSEMSGESSSRADISLPENQSALLDALVKTGKPVVLVLFTGRPLVLKWEKEHLPAILNVWFGGTEAGNAIADVLFGEVNPSGRLSTTFPQVLGQVPIYYNHKNTGRPLSEGKWFKKFRSNYLDVSNDPLYPFGYGLSYTSFEYGKMELSNPVLQPGKTITASVTVTNSGHRDGVETVQLYIRDIVGSITRPLMELKGFQKVVLKAGESRKVSFAITDEDLKFYNSELKYLAEPGEFALFIGRNCSDLQMVKFELVR